MARIKSILLVDDDEDLCNALSEQFLATGEFTIERAFCHKEILGKLRSHNFDAVIMAESVQGKDGKELCTTMRKQNLECPIVMLADQNSISDSILGRDMGVNDYVGKPFKFSALLARIRSQLQQFAKAADPNLDLGPYVFNPKHKYLVKEDGQKIKLTDKETKILKLLLQSESVLVQRDVLLHKVWGYNPDITTHTLETHIYRLRQKIEQDPANSRFLITEAGGYKIVA